MSKHKHFHGIKSGVQMLQHGRREGLGPFRRHPRKKAAQGATNTQSGKAEQKSDQLQCSASSLSESKEDSQA